MPDTNSNGSKPKTKKEWTLMFYFASDNPLAPSVVSQLKALKNAGYHDDVNVIAQFDPHSRDMPVHVFDVNSINKLKARGKSRVGSGSDAYVRNLVLDKLWGPENEEIREQIRRYLNKPNRDAQQKPPNRSVYSEGRAASTAVPAVDLDLDDLDLDDRDLDDPESKWCIDTAPIDYDPPKPSPKMSREQTPEEALTTFLDFCREEYPAKHYMLFVLGHGVVVGNDLFLFDEDAKEHSLSLTTLGSVLADFTRKLPSDDGFELIGFHSCSMSSLEVAYELRGTAKYMIASQGPAFVGSWPYTQILMRVLKDAEKNKKDKEEKKAENETKIETMIKDKIRRIFYYCLYNSLDFQLAGYSFDLTLSDLREVPKVTPALRQLTRELSDRLKEDRLVTQLILLAHWEAQSYFQEKYTDIYDFCRCLKRNCENIQSGVPKDSLNPVISACGAVMDQLERGTKDNDDRVIVRSAFAGPATQYSNGFSVYFPWSQPPENAFWPAEYESYVFEETGWREFLDAYFEVTLRPTQETEAINAGIAVSPPELGSEQAVLESISVLVFNEAGQLGKGAGSDETGKGAGSDPTGDSCDCTSIKNYPSITRERRETAFITQEGGETARNKIKLQSSNFYERSRG